MAVTEQVKDMLNQGIQEQDIIQKLTEQGISPLEINQSLEQARIKSAISRDETAMAQQSGEMEQSVMESQEQPEQQAYPTQEYPQYQEQQYPQEQQQYSNYQPYAQINPDTITEIAESVAEEKLSAFKKSMGNIEELKKITSRKVEDIDERLKKIEKIIELLQKSIISNMGNYGQAIENIQQEMGMMQDTFSKALNPLIDEARQAEETETQHPKSHTQHPSQHQAHPQPHKKQKHAIDNYLRR